MKEQQLPRQIVADYMVKSPVIVEPWQPVAHARQLMLMHSFSFLPVLIGKSWKLVPELSMARYLHRSPNRKKLLATTIEHASSEGLDLLDAVVVAPMARLSELLDQVKVGDGPMLWLISDEHGGLSGVLSPFELM
jgi:CBS domain containing-hemolysin-like protein